MVDASGNKYEGDFIKGRRHGHGVIEYYNGAKFVGKWRKGKKFKGVYTYSDGRSVSVNDGKIGETYIPDEITKIDSSYTNNDETSNQLSEINNKRIYKNLLDDTEYSKAIISELSSVDYQEMGEKTDSMDAYEDYKNLLEFYNNGDYQKVLDRWKKTIQKDLSFPAPVILKGHINRKQKQYDDAIKSYKTAISIDRKNHFAYFGLGNTYSDLEEHDKAIENYKITASLNPEFPSSYNNLGVEYAKLNQLYEAIENFEKAIKIDPNHYLYYYNIGIAYYKLRMFTKSIENYNISIDLNSEFAPSYNNLGTTHYALKDFQKAVGSYKKAIQIDPDAHLPYYNSGVSLRRIGEYETSIENYNKSLVLESKYYWAYYGLARCYDKLNDHEKAIINYNRMISEYPELPQLYIDLGNIYAYELYEHHKAIDVFKRGTDTVEDAYLYALLGGQYNVEKKYLEGIENYNAAIKIRPNYDWAYFGAGECYRNLKNFPKAIEYYKKAISLDPDEPDNYYGLGRVHNDKEEYAKAIELFNKALGLDTKHGLSYFGLGLVYSNMGEIDKAIDNYMKKIEINPYSPAASFNIGLIYFNENIKSDEAIEFWKKSARLGSDRAIEELKELGIELPEIKIPSKKEDETDEDGIDDVKGSDERFEKKIK